jgi:hypothetical protein
MYAEQVDVGVEETPRATAGTHTMGRALDTYVAQRIPAALVEQAVRDGGAVEVHGVYPLHAADVIPGVFPIRTGPAFPASKVYNRIRPQYFWRAGARGRGGRGGQLALVVAVPPGRDYVAHYASLVAHHLAVSGLDPGALCRIVRYPVAERRIGGWTGLADLVRPGDRVLMGYVQELVPLLAGGPAAVVGERGNAYYGATRLAFRGSSQAVCALGVRFSFWGSIAAQLAEACQALGVREIVYAGKLGCLSSPEDVYGRLFTPSGYLNLGHGESLLDRAGAPPNGLLASQPELDSGVHVSVGTVVGEDVYQRARASEFGAVTIDNEIAQMARAVALGATPTTRSAFSALHFATDYLHRPQENESSARVTYDLTNHRRPDALLHKRAMLAAVARRLGRYFDRDLQAET